MRTRDDGDVLSAAVPGLKPWWRSVGFWLGLWGVVFLVWVWVDSFSHGSWVILRKEATVGMAVDYNPFRGAVHEGRLILQFERPVDATAELDYEMRKPEVGRGEELLFVYYANSAWGRKVWKSGDVWIASFTSDYEVREWWCSMGFVVAGYVGVWICAMVVWRRWGYRRWRESVEGKRGEKVGRRRWWRSMGFLLGLPGLVFLVWLWVDSFSHRSHVGVQRRVTHVGSGYAMVPWSVTLQQGSVIYQRGRVVDETGKAKVGAERLDYVWRIPAKRSALSLWGSNSVKPLTWEWGWVYFESRGWWCSFGFVVLGYVMVWVGTLVMWRWWVRRRGEGVC